MDLREIDLSGNDTGTPTEYCGVLMRSKTEAAWAQLFDMAGVIWEHEPRVFSTSIKYRSGNAYTHHYTPDFWVSSSHQNPDWSAIVETKVNTAAGVKNKLWVANRPIAVLMGFPEKGSRLQAYVYVPPSDHRSNAPGHVFDYGEDWHKSLRDAGNLGDWDSTLAYIHMMPEVKNEWGC